MTPTVERENEGSDHRRPLVVSDALLVEELLQLTLLEHLADDVAAADELALHVELRNRRPVAEGLDALTNAHVLKHVHVLVLDAEVVEDLRHLGGETALRKPRRALHEEHDVVGRNRLCDPVVNGLLVCHGIPLGSMRRFKGALALLEWTWGRGTVRVNA